MIANKAKRERLRNRQQMMLTNSGSGFPRQDKKTKNNSVLPTGGPTSLMGKDEALAVGEAASAKVGDIQSHHMMNLADTIGKMVTGLSSQKDKEKERGSSSSQRSRPHHANHRLALSFSSAANNGHDGNGGGVSGKSMMSTASKLSEYQELAIMASGGLLLSSSPCQNDNEEEEDNNEDDDYDVEEGLEREEAVEKVKSPMNPPPPSHSSLFQATFALPV